MTSTAYRNRTTREHRTAQLETWARHAVVSVSLAAAAASFFALYWVGTTILGWPVLIAALFPVAVDGLAMVAAVATVLFTEHRALRAYAWVVFALLLAVSLTGNVGHAHAVGTPGLLPGWLFTAFAAAPPVIVALGVHLYALVSQHGVGDTEDAENRGKVLVDPDTFKTGKTPTPAPGRPQPRPRTETPTENPAPVAAPAGRAPLVRPAEREAYNAWRALLADGQTPSGATIARLLAETQDGKRVSDQYARKVRARWEQARTATPALAAVTGDTAAAA